MAIQNLITKALAGAEDILFGQGTVQQTRGGQALTITKLNGDVIPYSGDTATADMVSLNTKIDEVDAAVAGSGAHTGDTNNPHNVTKAQVGLSAVNNTSDVAKPVSTLQATAIALSAKLLGAGQILKNTVLQDLSEKVNILGVTTISENIDFTLGAIATLTLGVVNTTLTFSGAHSAGNCSSLTLEITQGVVAGRTITWPASVKWPGGIAPILTTVVNAVDIITLYTLDGGVTYRAGSVWLDSK